MYDVNITAQTLLRNSTYLLPRCVATASALGCVCTASIVFGGKWGGGYFVVLYLYHSILNVLPCSFSILLCFCTDIIRLFCCFCTDIIRLFCGRVVLFYLCLGTAPTFSAVEIDIGTYDCIVDLAAVLHDTALLIASYSFSHPCARGTRTFLVEGYPPCRVDSLLAWHI
jgi:hypothetical protein